jgi:hypothetical protein
LLHIQGASNTDIPGIEKGKDHANGENVIELMKDRHGERFSGAVHCFQVSMGKEFLALGDTDVTWDTIYIYLNFKVGQWHNSLPRSCTSICWLGQL